MRDPARSLGTVHHACSIRDLELYLGGMLQVQLTMPAVSGILTSIWVASWSPTRALARSSGTVHHACSIRDLDFYLGGILESHKGPDPLFRYSWPCLQYQGS
jgi:hypothetical protein